MYRVVLVEDHPIVCSAVQALLESQGQFEVVAMRDNGTAGLAAIRELQPDLVVLDLNVPQLGGMEIIARLRGDGVNVGILVMSGGEENISALRALRAGANGFIHKTGDLNELAMAALMVARGRTYFAHEVLTADRGAGGAKVNEGVHNRLTQKEFEVFQCLVAGQSYGEICEHMLLSNKTISAYKIRIMAKLGARNLRELIELAQQENLI